MANRVKWKRCKLQVIVDFSARFGEKNSSLDTVKTFNDQLHLKESYESVLLNIQFFYGKTQVKSTPCLQEQQTAADTDDTSSQSTLFQPGQTPPGEANMLQQNPSNPMLFQFPIQRFFLVKMCV